MTYKQWEETLLNYLRSLDEVERNEIVSYYQEIYSDKRDTGMPESEIVATFGDPILAAARILKEHGEDESVDTSNKDGEVREQEKSNAEEKVEILAPVSSKTKKKERNSYNGISVSKVIGWFFITLLFLIPLAAVIISVIATLAALTISGGVMTVAGVLGAVCSPLLFIAGYNVGGVLAAAGGSLVVAGIGAILTVAFYYLTKYSVISTYKVTRHIVRSKKK